MAISKKPNKSTKDINKQYIINDHAAELFIANAEKNQEESTDKKLLKIPVTIRFDPVLLKKIDKAARQRGVNRTAWIHYTISQLVESEENSNFN